MASCLSVQVVKPVVFVWAGIGQKPAYVVLEDLIWEGIGIHLKVKDFGTASGFFGRIDACMDASKRAWMTDPEVGRQDCHVELVGSHSPTQPMKELRQLGSVQKRV